jgi:vacuolar protein sorting-associated protein 13A/C
MFEQGLAYVLKQFLGEFVEDSSILQEKIQIGVWSGYVVLEQLVLKKEVFALLNAPIALSYGVIGRFELRIPWGHLGVEPVIVIIDGLHLLLEPKYEWDPKARDKREQTLKQAKLAAVELFATKTEEPTDDPLQGYKMFAQRWLMESVVRKIVDNVQVTVRDLHIRYEDHVSCPTNFCVGVSFESLHAQSRPKADTGDQLSSWSADSKERDTERGRERSKSRSADSTSFEKVVELNHLAVYWDPIVHNGIDACTSTFIGRGPVEIGTLMSRTIARKSHQFIDRPLHHYILQPVDITCALAVCVNGDMSRIDVDVNLNIGELSVYFEDNQFREVVSLATNMVNFTKLEEFSGYRPNTSPRDDPKGWWR